MKYLHITQIVNIFQQSSSLENKKANTSTSHSSCSEENIDFVHASVAEDFY